MPITKPTSLPRWGEVAGSQGVVGPNEVEPSAGKKDIGWVPGEEPPAGFFDWWMRLVYDWLQYINDLGVSALTWVAVQTFQAGIVVTQSTANGHAVNATGNGTGSALLAESSATGPGVTAIGNGSGPAALCRGLSTGPGVQAENLSTGPGLVAATASSTQPALRATGGSAHAAEFVAGTDGTGNRPRGAINLVPQAAPTAPADGDMWIETTTNTFKVRINGVTKTVTLT